MYSKTCIKSLFTISVAVLIFAIGMAGWGFPKIVKSQVKKSIQLDNSSKMYEKWLKLPIPLKFKVYVFNVSNPDEVNSGEKPILSEIGPYVYNEYRERTVLGYGENDTIKYMLKKTFVFDKEASGGLSQDDVLTVINLSYMGAILTVNDMMPGFTSMINTALEQFFPNLNDPFLRIRVGDLFFDGIFLNCVGNNSALALVCSQIRAQAPPTMIRSEDGNGFIWSMFGHMNRTETGPYEMVRGTKNIADLGHIVSYKGQTVMNHWDDKYCGALNGSDSSIFPPIDESNVPERLYTFEPDVCRSLYASLVGKTTLFNMSAYYYEISSSALASKSAEPNNKCFCRRNWSGNHDACLLMGVINLLPCQGASVVASLPHFYLASEELLEYFAEGIQPNKTKHNTYAYLEPVTGAVMKGSRKLQFNVELRQMKDVPQLENVQTGLFPLLWVDESAEIPLSIQDELRDAHKLLGYVEIARWLFLVLALAFAVVAMTLTTLAIFPRTRNSVDFILRTGNVSGMNGDKLR